MSSLVKNHTTVTTPDNWTEDVTITIARFAFVYAGQPVLDSVFKEDAGSKVIPDTATVNSMGASYRLNGSDSGNINVGILFKNATGSPAEVTDSILATDFGDPDVFGTASGTFNVPAGGWSPAKVNGCSVGLRNDFSSGNPYPARIRWIIKDGATVKLTSTTNFTLAAPTATTNAASNVTVSTATLNGTLNPNGANADYPVSYHFEWGLTAAYGNSTSTIGGQTGASNIPVSAALSGLTGSTTYHFRLVATNGDNTVNGADQTFFTINSDPVVMTF